MSASRFLQHLDAVHGPEWQEPTFDELVHGHAGYAGHVGDAGHVGLGERPSRRTRWNGWFSGRPASRPRRATSSPPRAVR